ncbi:HEAT repeat domain-containing protein [Spirochaeta isovalerica]|uniref:HEAT repeat protein n=1 Tax=Spirochaeta isovalerica TaxID=150 RepID=A0A841R4R3_9SPIO|nr:HEAT repeat domain-containing protein [Spirochaeta isovalerica]MBB6478806.1 HEAT repeat protein [Spirochaeta isovalerica]
MILLFPTFAQEEGEPDKEELTSVREDRIRTLKYGIDDEVVAIITAIQNEKDETYNDVLIDILNRSGNSKIKTQIISFFETQEDNAAEDFALNVLKMSTEDYDVDEKVLTAVISYCGTLKLESSAEFLYQLSDNKSKTISASAIRNLGKTGVTTNAEKFLERIQDEDFEDDEDELRESVILLLGELKYKPAVLTLMDIAQDDGYSSVARRYACDSLGKIGDEQAIPVLKELLNDSDSILRSYAISSLAYFDTNEIEDILIQALRDSFWRIRVAAAKALSERKSTSAVDILIYKAEKDPEANVKKAAMEALAVIGNNTALSFLSDYYQDNKNSDAFRSTAITVLLKENAGKAVDAMKVVFEEEWEKDSSWLLNYTCKELSTTENASLRWFYEKMLDHKNYIINIYAVRGIRLNNIISLYGRVRDIAEDESKHQTLRKEAASL